MSLREKYIRCLSLSTALILHWISSPGCTTSSGTVTWSQLISLIWRSPCITVNTPRDAKVNCDSQTYGQLPCYRHHAITVQLYSRTTCFAEQKYLCNKQQQDCAYTHHSYISYLFLGNHMSTESQVNFSSSGLTCPPVSSEVWGSLMLTNAP